MTTSAQLEREAEETRSEIAATLQELRERMTPGQVLDQLLDYVREGGGGRFVHNFRRQVVANPIPVTLVGAGLAWLAMASRRPGTSTSRGNSAIGRAVGDVRAETNEAMQGVHDAWSGDDQTWAAAEGWSDSARETANEAGGRLKGTAGAAASTLSDAASKLSDNMASGGRSIVDLLKDQPLVLAGLGLALGALLGAVLPGTEAEDRLMGDASDAAKGEATGFAEQQFDQGKAAAEEGWRAVGQELGRHQDEEGRAARATSANTPFAEFPDQDGEAPLVPSNESRPAESATYGTRGKRERAE